MTPTVTVAPQRDLRWRFMQVWTLSIFGIFSLIAIPLMLLAEWTVLSAALLIATPTLAYAFIGLAVGVYWGFGPGRVTYECDGVNLWATRRGTIVRSVRCADIDTWEVSDSITWIDLLLLVGMPPDLPTLVVDLKDPRVGIRTESFPEILLWGEEAVVNANRALGPAVNSSSSHD